MHYANKGQATAGILLYQVLSMDKELLWFLWEAQPGSAQHCQIVSRELLGRQALSIIAYLVLNLICSLT